ncbi:MAG: hypothetical protein ACRDR6_11785 [Pseudonocardiaceae bacterium]
MLVRRNRGHWSAVVAAALALVISVGWCWAGPAGVVLMLSTAGHSTGKTGKRALDSTGRCAGATWV